MVRDHNSPHDVHLDDGDVIDLAGYRRNLDGLQCEFIEASILDFRAVVKAINDLAQKIVTLTGSSSETKHAPTRSGDVKHSRASAEKLAATGWQPRFGFQQGLAQTLGA